MIKEKTKKQKAKQLLQKKECKCVERYFFKYAFPCAQVKVRLGSLTPEKYKELEETFLQNDYPNKEELEKTFPPAFRRIKKLSEDCWDPEIIKEYWEKNHNEVIDQGDGMYGIASEEFKDLCKVHIAKITKIDENKLTVKYNDKTRIVSNFLVQDANVGDKVRIHFAYAIEKINFSNTS